MNDVGIESPRSEVEKRSDILEKRKRQFVSIGVYSVVERFEKYVQTVRRLLSRLNEELRTQL